MGFGIWDCGLGKVEGKKVRVRRFEGEKVRQKSEVGMRNDSAERIGHSVKGIGQRAWGIAQRVECGSGKGEDGVRKSECGSRKRKKMRR